LRRRQRLLKAGDFRAVYAARARASDGRLVVYARPNGLDLARLGVSVGKRCGESVARTRVRRLLRESFRQARAGFLGGYDIVIVPILKAYTFADVDRSVRALVPEAIRRAERQRTSEGPQKGQAVND
jgi:ribonuclease P protein component